MDVNYSKTFHSLIIYFKPYQPNSKPKKVKSTRLQVCTPDYFTFNDLKMNAKLNLANTDPTDMTEITSHSRLQGIITFAKGQTEYTKKVMKVQFDIIQD